MPYDDAAAARRRIWVGAVKDAPSKETPFANSKGSELPLVAFKGPYKPDGAGYDVPLMSREDHYGNDVFH